MQPHHLVRLVSNEHLLERDHSSSTGLYDEDFEGGTAKKMRRRMRSLRVALVPNQVRGTLLHVKAAQAGREVLQDLMAHEVEAAA